MSRTIASARKTSVTAKKASRTKVSARSTDSRGQPSIDWQSDTLAQLRTIVQRADPDIVEEVKWRKPSNGMRGVPVWSRNGIICTGETYKTAVKMTFAKGAALKDPSKLFNASLEGSTRRAIDFHEGEKIDEKALQELIRAAVALNTTKPKK